MSQLRKPERLWVVVNGGGHPHVQTISTLRKDAIAKYNREAAKWNESYSDNRKEGRCNVVPAMLCPIDEVTLQPITKRTP